MLFITRKEAESVVVMNEIEVEILKIDEDSVRIGIKAPPDVSVHRFEVFRKIKKANQIAARSKRQAANLRKLSTISTQPNSEGQPPDRG